ncbi:MAG TPA: IS110 family transposase [Candidatus Angelobacter sp.]|jgi:transposase|nr:IS110 family transposase [Candidatus Angelobacter sp.]
MQRKATSQSSRNLPIIGEVEANAAGLDVGARKVYVAVPEDRDAQPVRSFDSFTEDLERMADWLLECGITSVAMESTGVYWIPVFDILERKGLRVCLVNAHHVKHVPGRKSDVQDCQWLQYLHAVGLLRGSFHPEDKVRALRAIMRHRDSLIEMAAAHTQHMHKALTQMNLQIHHVLSDITGVSGLAIIDAILKGERNAEVLAGLRDGRVQASEEIIRKSLVGNYRREHLFTLEQSLKAFRQYQALITACDQELAQYVNDFPSPTDGDLPPLAKQPNKHRPRKNELRLELRSELYRLFGTDLTAVPGINTLTWFTLLTELGPEISKFPSSPAFTSWLCLCPNNRQSGQRILSSQTRRSKNRINHALRVAAQTLHHSNSSLGAFYRRLRARLGAPKAITATAHKLARILFHLITTRQPYDESVFALADQQQQQRHERHLRKQAESMGFSLVRAEVQPA